VSVEYIRVRFIGGSENELVRLSLDAPSAKMLREASRQQEVHRIGQMRVIWDPVVRRVRGLTEAKTRDIERLNVEIGGFSG
jgi:hypothetical protein